MPAAPSPRASPRTVEIRLTGVVQGVGFRPFVHRMALRFGLEGSVRNESGAVTVLASGPADRVAGFCRALRDEAPPLARIDSMEVRDSEVDPQEGGFHILSSETSAVGRLPVSPDVALCEACEAELADPSSPRFRYPFITCTDCGPRFTVIEGMPYDRERTSMRVFPQCRRCLEEYQDPRDRRYHSETNSCPECGPRVWLELPASAEAAEVVFSSHAAIRRAADLISAGTVLALRGLGGFHLCADATSSDAVSRLRTLKNREAKPLAVMVGSLEEARVLGRVGPGEETLLQCPQRPIVLLDVLPDAPLAPEVAPGMGSVGVMVAYTPLHRLLLEAAGRPLVMTSGNRSEEPIATGNPEARARLAGIADGFLLHDREIVARYDDSVVRPTPVGPVFLRRARGYAPLPVAMPLAAETPLLAVGPHLKNTFTLAQDSTAWVSQHIGDLENLETLRHFRESLARFQALFRITPQAVVADLHPGYLSTREAEEISRERGIPLLPPVQHHHAHIAAVLGEHGRTDQVLGLAFDGTGYGDDGAVWGAEFLVADLEGYRRVAHLDYAPLPGGDRAARRPWRSALGYLWRFPGAEAVLERVLAEVDPMERDVVIRQLQKRINSPRASSMGRLFDAAAAILGIRSVARFEGEAPMELEALAGNQVGQPLPDLTWHSPRREDGTFTLDPRPLLVALGRSAARGTDPGLLAAGFHDAVVRSVTEVAVSVLSREGLDTVALGGGVFQNARLLTGLTRGLGTRGIQVLRPTSLSPNDGSISYGQALVATARLAAGRPGVHAGPGEEAIPSDGETLQNQKGSTIPLIPLADGGS